MPLTGEVQGLSAVLCVDCLYMASPQYATACSGSLLLILVLVSCLLPVIGGEGNGTPLQCACLENPMDGEAWWAAIYGVAQSRTRLKGRSGSSNRNHHMSALICLHLCICNRGMR